MISKIIERHLFEYYSNGVLTSHSFPLRSKRDDDGTFIYQDINRDFPTDESTDIDGDVRSYWSYPDAEGILSATNAIQSDAGLNDFISQFKNNIYIDGDNEVTIKAAKITYPHYDNATRHNIPAPHPAMPDDQLKRYLYPVSSLNRNNETYRASLWIDIGEPVETLDRQNEYGEWEATVIQTSHWRRVMDIPIQVGSNRCNLAILRSYLDDDTYDENYDMTWGERTRIFLEDTLRWEPLIPDGYFIIQGKMKRVNISDKLMMNMSYVVKQSVAADYGTKKMIPIRERAAEVRSVRTELGLAFLRIILVAPPRDELSKKKGMNNEIFKFYNSTLCLMIDREFDEPMNVFDVIRAYGVIVLNMDNASQPMNDLYKCIDEYCHGDREIMRIATVTMAKAGNQDITGVINTYRYILTPAQNRNVAQSDISQREIASKLRRKLLPHCEIGNLDNPTEEDLRQSYMAKIRFLSMMIIDLILSVTYKPGSKEYRREPTDRKDFAYKRWEAFGHRIRDHMRGMFVPRSQFKKIGKDSDNKDIVQYNYGTISLTKMEKASGQLRDFMNRNQWPTKYRLGGTFKARKDEHKDGIVDDVPKYNQISMIDSYRTVKIAAKAGPNTSNIRRVHTSQWGQQCPANTPENSNIGLNNNMAETCLITHELLRVEKDALEDLISTLEKSTQENGYLLLVDGNPRGYYNANAYESLIDARRQGSINIGIGIARHTLWMDDLPPGIPVIVIRTSHGRPIFPVLILDQSIDKVNQILSLTDETASTRDLMSNGLLQFIDAYELVYNAVVAPWIYTAVKEYEETGIVKYTHAMIKPGHILSQASNCLSFIEHNPAARGTYATQHIKQAIGRPFLHPEDRYDHETNYLFNPEPPLITTDSMRRLLYPKYQPESGIHPRDIGIGRNVNIVCMSFDGNNDDGLIISQSLYDSGVFDGEHFSITSSDRNVLISSSDTYDWMIDENTKKEIRDERGQGIPDPDFSASIVVPYGDPYIVDVSESIYEQLLPISINGTEYLELISGELYIRYGYYSAYIITYRDNVSGIESESVLIPGEQLMNIPGKTIINKEKGQRIYRYALVYISEERVEDYRERSLHREHRPSIIGYESLIENSGIIDTRFLTGVNLPDRTEIDEIDEINWYAMKSVPIPRTQLPGMINPTRTGTPIAIRPRRQIQRGDTAIKKMTRKEPSNPDSEVLDVKGERERFEITHGYIDGIERGTPIKVRSAMPIGPKPGNKYAALYAQKSVIARISPDEEMPRARWYNSITEKWEEMRFDVVFNPLSFPSRMTIGMEYEIFIAGTLRYLFDIQDDNGTTLREMYQNDRDEFNDYMIDRYDIEDASLLIDELSDSTCFIYNNEEKYFKCRELRTSLGIPSTGLYDVYLRDTKGEVSSDILHDLPDSKEWTRKIETPLVCGTVYYVALRHLVDNKRRARGYVGRRDPLTLQPVKGRRKNGGANTGTMETDAYKAHGAGAMLLERLSRVSDYKQFLKCSYCGGLVSKIGSTNTLRCIDCTRELSQEEVIEHETVNSWNLFRHYVRALGIEIYEQFE